VPSRLLVIVNPKSRSGATGRRWRAVEEKLRDSLGELEVERTRGPRDAERIAREGVRAGVERIVVAGGDGTTSEVVSGLLSAGLEKYAEVGLLPLGTGGDLARTLEVPRDLDAAIARLVHGASRRLDAGHARFRDRAGRESSTHFANIASFGVSGLTTELVNRTTKAFGGRASFLLGTLRALAQYRSAPVALRVDDELVYQGRLNLGTAANGQFFGGGMRVAPDARLDDGLLDVVVVGDLSKARLVANLPRLYAGTHLAHPAITHRRGARVEARGGAETWVEIDGEPLGTLPASFEVIPKALSFFGCA
jgi:YegS/Rv2252/BmrU family lipid kinase